MTVYRIFIVEDETIVAKDIAETLKSMGYGIAGTARSGEIAIGNVAETGPDLVLMDIHLAGELDGVQTAEEIHKTSDIPVIYLTAYADKELLDRAKHTGPYAYLIKPYDERELQSAIEIALYKYTMDQKLKSSEERLKKLNEELEARVAARTASLQQQMEFLQQLIDAIPAPVYYKDVQGQYLGCNNAFATYTGIPKREIEKKTDADLFSPDMAARYAACDSQLLSRGGVQAYPATFPHADRHSREVIFNKATFHDPLGNVAGFIGVMTDITERKQAEDALALERERLESLLTLSQMSHTSDRELISRVVEDSIRLTGSTIGYLATVNEDESVMTMQYWSTSAHAACGVIDKPIVYPVEKTGLWGETIRQRIPIITNDYAADCSFKRGTPVGHVPLRRHMNIPVFEENHIVAVVGVGNKKTDYNDGDILQLQLLMNGWWSVVVRKRADEILRESEEKFRMIFEHSHDAILLMEVLPDGMIGRIIDVNDMVLAQTGYTKEELLSGTTARIDSPDMIRKLPGILPGLFANGYATLESEVLRKDGTLLPVDLSIRLVKYKGTRCIISTARAITRRKRAEEALKKSVVDLSRAQQVANIGSWSFNPVTREVSWSDQMYDIFTIPRTSPITYDLFKQVVLPEDRKHAGRVMADALAGSLDFFDLEYRILIEGGHIRNIYELTEISRDAQGRPMLVFGTSQDVTERIQAEDILKESERKYRTLVETASEGIFITQDGFIPFANPKALELFGVSSAELAQKPFLDFVHPDDRQGAVERGGKRLRGEFVEPVSFSRIIDHQGTVHWLEINAVRIPWNGNPATLNFVTDITQRKKAEVALMESEEKYRSVIENIQDIFYRTDDQGRLIMASPSLARLLGYESLDECLGQPMAERLYLEPGMRAVFLKELERKGSVLDYEVVLRKKDGSPVTVATSSHYYYDKAGKVLGVEGVFRDITERKRAGEALVASLHEKELLLKEIHHRVKNNLQTISSLLYLQSLSTDNEEQIAILKEARSRVMSMGLIHQKLYQSADIAHIPFTDYIRGLIDFLEESYGVDPEKIRTLVEVCPADLTMEIDTGIPCGLIINELVTNALKYAFRGRDCGTIRIQMEQDAHEYILTVSDDGTGIPEELDLTTTKSLGMTIVTDLVSQLDGTLEITRHPGASYRIRFPCQ